MKILGQQKPLSAGDGAIQPQVMASRFLYSYFDYFYSFKLQTGRQEPLILSMACDRTGIGRSIFLFGGHVIGAPVSSSSLVVDAPRNSTRPYNLSPTRETVRLVIELLSNPKMLPMLCGGAFWSQ